MKKEEIVVGRDNIVSILKDRFDKNMKRHESLEFNEVLSILDSDEKILDVLIKMEQTGGEPDVISLEDGIFYVDFSKETPIGRRSICYDEKALDARKANKPKTSAEEMAIDIGIEMLNEKQYQEIQNIEAIDLKTSSWLKTPESVRKLGGAIFGDRRFDRVFIYHNGADSYYGVRGFRGLLKIK